MKRTVILIVVLIFAATMLLFYAISSKPSKKLAPKLQNPTVIVSPSPTIGTTISFFPEAIVLATTDTATFDIMINTNDIPVTSVQLELGYDPLALTNIQIKKGTFLPTANVFLSEHDEVNGRISYALFLPPTASPVTGSGIVATLTVKKNSTFATPNQTTITLLPKSLVNALGISGSVLKEMRNATITFPNTNPTFINPSGTIIQSTPQ